MAWTIEEDQRVLNFRDDDGLSFTRIGQMLGKSRHAVRHRYNKLKAEEEDNDPAHRHRVEFSESGNYAEAISVGRITTLDQLLEACAADLSIWKVHDWGAKKWEVGAKSKEGYMRWGDGKIVDGSLDYKGIVVQDLWSVWAKFTRRKLQPLLPVITPITCNYTPPPTPKPSPCEYKRSMVICDLQSGFRRRLQDAKLIPFHDRRVLDLALQVCRDEQPEYIIFAGDTADLADWSDRWVKEPSFYFTTQPMILEIHWWLRQFREACPNSQIVLCQGNHEDRVPKMMLTHLVSSYGLRAADEIELPPQLSLPRLWALHELGIEWSGGYPDEEYWLTPWLRVRHGHRVSATPGATARIMLEYGVSTIFAHCHRKEWASRTLTTSDGPNIIHAWSPGCACHIDGRVPGHKKGDNWQQGLGEVMFTDDGLMSTMDASITEGSMIWNGRIYHARDRLPDLRRDIPDWNW